MTSMFFLLSTIRKNIYKNLIILDCNWANYAAKFKCTLNTIKNEKAKVEYKFPEYRNRNISQLVENKRIKNVLHK